VQQRQRRRALDGIGHLVHRVGAQHQQLGAGSLERPGGVGQRRRRLVPACLLLQPFDLGEVERVQQAACRVEAAEPVSDQLVGEPVVLGRRLPAHPADQSDHPHPACRPLSHVSSLPVLVVLPPCLCSGRYVALQGI